MPNEPVVAAYEIDTGALRWVVCEPPAPLYRTVRVATDDAVYIEWYDTTAQLAAYDAATGDPVDANAAPADPDPAASREPDAAVEYEGMTITGGQDDPTSVSGTEATWTQPGSWVYDDVLAIGDGAIFALDRSDATRPPHLDAYELATGEVRWSVPVLDPYVEGAWPYHVAGQRLFTLWFELQVRSTTDGSLLWQTDYLQAPTTGGSSPTPTRLTGVRANASTVYVAFSSTASGGD